MREVFLICLSAVISDVYNLCSPTMRRKLGRKSFYLCLFLMLFCLSILLVSVIYHKTYFLTNKEGENPNRIYSWHGDVYTSTRKTHFNYRKLVSLSMETNLNLTAVQEYVYENIDTLSRRITRKTIQYYNLSRPRIDHADFEFLINGANICAGLTPFLVVIIPSAPQNIKERLAIRETWGKYATTLQVPPPNNESAVALAFLLGKDVNASNDHAITNESRKFQDIVYGNYKDTYKNLTRKILVGLKWIKRFCSKSEYILKADDDVYVHIPRLVESLKRNPAGQHGAVYGKIFRNAGAFREGKWAVSFTDYPLWSFPPYASGSAYVISSNIVSKLLTVSQYMPYLHIEDAFITGVLTFIIEAKHVPMKGFTYAADRLAVPCKFMSENKTTGLVRNVRMMETMWYTQQHYPRSVLTSADAQRRCEVMLTSRKHFNSDSRDKMSLRRCAHT